MDPITLAILGGSALMQFFGAKKAANASRDAARIQSDSNDRAAALQYLATQQSLGFLRDEQQFNRAQQAPYRALGTGAVQTLGSLTGVPMVTPPGAGLVGPQTNSIPGSLGSYGMPGGGQMVTLEDPNTGERRQFPWERAQRYIAKGARVVS